MRVRVRFVGIHKCQKGPRKDLLMRKRDLLSKTLKHTPSTCMRVRLMFAGMYASLCVRCFNDIVQ
jgi:hypothetical protein